MTRHCMGSRATMFPVRVTVLVGAVPQVGHKLAPSAIGLDRPPGPRSDGVDTITYRTHRWAGRAGATAPT